MIKEITLKSKDNQSLILTVHVDNEDEIELKVKEWFLKNLDYAQYDYQIIDIKQK